AVVHVGFGGYPSDLRNKCRHRIDLGRDRRYRRMQRTGATADAKTPVDGGSHLSPPRRPSGAGQA
ncbi:MAG: hypothetical protein J2P51_15455, partial [Hyphomicrobiaceae bacterium]|nr:hypothetical protein [Hyphomicrobiaceae bacterium]